MDLDIQRLIESSVVFEVVNLNSTSSNPKFQFESSELNQFNSAQPLRVGFLFHEFFEVYIGVWRLHRRWNLVFKIWVEQLKGCFWSSSFYTLLDVINFHAFWFSEMVSANSFHLMQTVCSKSLELILAMFRLVFYQDASKSLLRSGSHL